MTLLELKDLTWVVKVEGALLGLGALLLVELAVEGVLGQRDDLPLGAVALAGHLLHDPLADGRLSRTRNVSPT